MRGPDGRRPGYSPSESGQGTRGTPRTDGRHGNVGGEDRLAKEIHPGYLPPPTNPRTCADTPVPGRPTRRRCPNTPVNCKTRLSHGYSITNHDEGGRIDAKRVRKTPGLPVKSLELRPTPLNDQSFGTTAWRPSRSYMSPRDVSQPRSLGSIFEYDKLMPGRHVYRAPAKSSKTQSNQDTRPNQIDVGIPSIFDDSRYKTRYGGGVSQRFTRTPRCTGINLVDGQLAKAPLGQSPVLTLITHEQAVRPRLTPERINRA